MLVGMSARAVLLVAVLAACSSSPKSHLYPAGSEKDDGYGDLAQKSARLVTSAEPEAALFPPHHHRALPGGDPYGGDPYGGAAYGGTMYGSTDDVTDAPIPPPSWSHRHAPPPPRGNPTTGLTGAIEGTVTWRGAFPAPLVTACGAVDNPGVRVGANRAVGGVLVYIEHVETGRTIPSYARPASVGGTIAKRGCLLTPALQIITPLPAGLAIHGDATAVKLRVTSPTSAPAAPNSPASPASPTGPPAVTQSFELQEAGRVLLQAQAGVTRIEADDGSLGVAWVVAANTPYYAITDDTGRFRIDELAAGTYDVTVWRPPLASLADGKLVYGPPVITHRSIKVDLARPAHLDVALEH